MDKADLTRLIEPWRPKYRRRRKELASLTLDPYALAKPIPTPGPRDVLACGVPRSGTALLTAMIFQPPVSIGVMEPWDAMRMPPRELFAKVRRDLDRGRLEIGRLDIAAAEEGRVGWCDDGAQPVDVQVDDDVVVTVKFPTFWQYLDLLPEAKFLVCVRHPLEVVTSFRKSGGRLAEGLDYDIPFNRKINQELTARYATPIERRVGLYDLATEAILAVADRPNVHLVRYERWFDDPEGQIADVSAFIGAPLELRPIRLERRALQADPDDRAAVRDLCRTAERLGYDVRGADPAG